MNIITETRIDFLSWLSTKLYLISIGMYATIGLIMVLPVFLTRFFGIWPLVASFIAFFVVSFLRAAYESLVVYESPVKSLSLPKMLLLTFVTASVMSLVSYYIKPSVGYFSIPIAILLSLRVVTQLKAALWPAHERPGFFHELPTKLDENKFSMYGFYVFLVGISYLAVARYNLDFNYSFAAAFFIGMMFEEFYNLTQIYDQKPTAKPLLAMFIWSATCAITASALVWVMVGIAGISGQPATIISVILLKLIQPLGSRKFILEL